ncbi:radical SAM family heme chaperone HemW [secondary endosymbiont of Ctenarytaina eucalypti]|uniref:Heme chaperone HemW n=1 Tax=secondary endosymbiont of Ctenarytaina eucalypti TaxID=1199245 RepID=J3Z4J5_9ENTR|nr:radical SAM family heme chaperone HemW [secondary endosymbiont of Ctenarytaina eucalypti]AFP85219.1 putative oxygen-independent coproporphyrinogen III oxidase [secondary endosymbiont of Ctenarytaina eucalypti]
MPKLPQLSLYLHIPWCVKKCPYCDFNAHALKIELPHKEYVAHLLADLDHDIPLTHNRTINTLFIGGGTPSLLSSSAMQLLLDGVRQRLPIASDAEITIEANPGTAEINRFLAYREAGINRMSIGVQSFEPEQLSRLCRTHSAKEASHAARLAALLSIPSVNLDLMYGLPNQSVKSALNDLTKAIALAPQHISWYQLTIEPHTLFGSHPPPLPDDDTLCDIYERGEILLNAAGYCQYEISSYARARFQCRHNLNYWRFGDYLGIGCGAHGKLTRPDGTVVRTLKTRHPRGYMQSNYLAKHYLITPSELPFEYFMNRFRLLEAAPRVEFTILTGLSESTIRPALDQALAAGYISESDSHWQVTDKGKRFLNSLLELFI